MDNNMNYNFDKMKERVLYSLEKTDLEDIRNQLKNINDSTLVCGVGGSLVVAKFLSKVLEKKNDVISEAISPRDIIYKDLSHYKNVVSCSYSGNNLGVYVAFNNKLNKYLISRNKTDEVNNLNYETCDIEDSFISLSSTMIPMTIILDYYLDGKTNIINDIFDSNYSFNINNNDIYEILSGCDTSVAQTFLDSTITEAGLGIPIIHDKYDYCHGRSTLGYNYPSTMIFFNEKKQLDNLILSLLPKYYDNLIVLDKKYDDEILNEYYQTYYCMHLCKKIAELKNKDLSKVDYSQMVKKLYKYKGEM